MINQALANSYSSLSIDKGHITFLYKGDDRPLLSNYRSIILFNTLYKIDPKVLQQWLRLNLKEVIYSNQTSFTLLRFI